MENKGLDPFNLGKVDPIGGFVSEQNKDDVEVDLGDTRFEIISDEKEATFTKSPEMTEAEQKDSFGDLDKSKWAKRNDIENHFLAAKPSQKHKDWQSHPFKNSKKTIVFGTNGYMAWATECEDIKKFAVDDDDDEETDLEGKINDSREYAKCNPAAAYKHACSALEKSSVVRHTNYEIHNLQTSENAKLKAQELVAICKVDKSLLAPFKILGPKLSKKMKELPVSIKEPKPIESQQRPRNAFCSVKYWKEEESLPKADLGEGEGEEEVVEFKLLYCRVPYEKKKMNAGKKSTKEKNKTKEVKPKWNYAKHILKCVSGTTPSACFNDTHLFVVYQPAGSIDTGILRVSVFDASGTLDQPEKTFDFIFPEKFSMEGMLCTALSKEGVFAASLSSGAIIFDLESNRHCLWLDPGEITEEEDKNWIMRSVTSLSFSSQDSNLLCMGTDKGECYIVNWTNGEQYNIEHLPAVEPVFAASHSNNHTFMESVFGIVVCRPLLPIPVFVDMDRPIAYDTCGSLIAVMTKYGGLKIFHKKVRRLLYAAVPITQTKKHAINNVQHAYPGLKLFEESVVCVYPDGIVRKYQLILE